MNRLASLGSALALVLAACGGASSPASLEDAFGPETGDVATAPVVDTAVAPTKVSVDVAVEVTCSVTQDGVALQAATEITVTGTTDFGREGTKIAFHSAGTFFVACTAPGLGLVDPTPVEVTVTSARPTTIDTAVAPAEVVAGTDVTVTCTVLDETGKPYEMPLNLVIQPALTSTAGDTAASFKLAPTKVGVYTVACAAVDGSLTDTSPATLKVGPADLARVTTTVDPDHVAAGGTATVTCKGLDAYDNEVPGLTMTVTPPEGVTLQSAAGLFEVSGTKAGSYKLQCEATGAAPAVKKEPGTLTVTAGPAVVLTLALVPSMPGYKLTDVVDVTWQAADSYGNAATVEIGPIDLAPAGIATPGTTPVQFSFAAEGKVTFHACVKDLATVCGSVDAWCDGEAPALVITYPERGATLNGDRTVTVTGTVTDTAGGFSGLTINGDAVTVNPDGTFSYPMTASQGINYIDAKALDDAQNQVRLLRSFAYSTVWHPMDDPDLRTALVASGIKAWANQTLFYDANVTDTATLSAILADVLAGLDLAKLIPSPLTSVDQAGCKYDVFLYQVTFNKPTLELKTKDGGLSLHVVIPKLKGNGLLKKTGGYFYCPGSNDVDISADTVDLAMDIGVGVDAPTHAIVLAAGQSAITMTGFNVTLSNGFWNFIVGLFQKTLQNLITDQFTSQVGNIVGTLNKSLAGLFAKPIELPVGALIEGMNPFTLKLSLEARTADFHVAGAAVDLDAMARGDKLVGRTLLGSIGRADCLVDKATPFAFDLADSSKIQLGIAEDFVGEILYSVWNQKGLHLHITSAGLAKTGTDLSKYGIADLDLVTAPLLPPILTDCTADGGLELQLGDFYTEASFSFNDNPLQMHFYLNLKVPATMAIVDDPTKGKLISLTVGQPTYSDLDLVWVNDAWVGQEDTVIGMVKDGILPLAFSQLAGKPITFAIPAFNLKSLGGTTIALPDENLLIVPNALTVTDGYVAAKADLAIQPVTPAP